MQTADTQLPPDGASSAAESAAEAAATATYIPAESHDSILDVGSVLTWSKTVDGREELRGKQCMVLVQEDRLRFDLHLHLYSVAF